MTKEEREQEIKNLTNYYTCWLVILERWAKRHKITKEQAISVLFKDGYAKLPNDDIRKRAVMSNVDAEVFANIFLGRITVAETIDSEEELYQEIKRENEKLKNKGGVV